jgi:hypothetical protein
MRGAIGSLNASVAGSILLFAAVAQRDPAGLGDKPARPTGADAWPVRNESDAAVAAGRKKSARGQSVVAPDASLPPETPDTGTVTPDEASPAAAETDAAPLPRTAKKPRVKASTPTTTEASAPATAKATRPRKPRATATAATAAETSLAKPARRRSSKAVEALDSATGTAEPTADGDDLLPGGPGPD